MFEKEGGRDRERPQYTAQPDAQKITYFWKIEYLIYIFI